MKYYLEKTDKVLNETESSENGLSVSDAEKKLLVNGPNRLAKAKKKTVLQRFAEQIINPMIIVLIDNHVCRHRKFHSRGRAGKQIRESD